VRLQGYILPATGSAGRPKWWQAAMLPADRLERGRMLRTVGLSCLSIVARLPG
jgi:hypothetical protein